jgi:hypothetical protein
LAGELVYHLCFYSWVRCSRSQGHEMTYKIAALVLALMLASPVTGDVLKDVDRVLCVPGPVSHCVADGNCNSELPENESIPNFIEVDLKRKTLATTKASGEGRSTPIQSQSRASGYIYLQGVENGRAYSMVISESTGNLTFVIATDGETAAMFGDCTTD